MTTVVIPIRGLSEGATGMAAGVLTRKQDRRTEVEELRMEVRAAGHDMQSIGWRIYAALTGGNLKTVEHEAGRLVTLGSEYAKA